MLLVEEKGGKKFGPEKKLHSNFFCIFLGKIRSSSFWQEDTIKVWVTMDSDRKYCCNYEGTIHIFLAFFLGEIYPIKEFQIFQKISFLKISLDKHELKL